MHKRLIASLAVASLFLSAGPASAMHGPPGEPMYRYLYYNNGQLVGVDMDVCDGDGVSPYPLLQWGYRTSDVHSYQWAECHAGWVEHIQS